MTTSSRGRNGGSRRRPTLDDVAKAASVSMMTVSRALRNSPNVSPETRQRIFEEIERLGYRPSLSARALRSGESNLISILEPNLLVPLHIDIMQGARDAAAKEGYRLLLHVDDPDPRRSNAFAADGEIVMGYKPGRAAAFDPSRTVSVIGDSPTVDVCNTDLPAVTHEAIMHLAAVGYRRVALIQVTDNTPIIGYQAAVREAGLPDDPELIQFVQHSQESLERAVQTLMRLPEPPDALAVIHTAGTPFAVDALQRLGYVPGRDIGFVGSEVKHLIWGGIMTPKLSVVRIPGYALGWTATERLIARLRGDTSPQQRITLPAQFIPRESTPGPDR